MYEQNIATDHQVNTMVLRVTATDIDTGDNAEVSYSLDATSDDTSYFSIDNSTGIIKLVRGLQESMVSGVGPGEYCRPCCFSCVFSFIRLTSNDSCVLLPSFVP